MPSNEEHIKHCKELYGYGFEEIHRWMDETSVARGANHRKDRHDIEKTPKKAFEIFKDRVPEEYREYIKDAVKSHISIDYFDTKNKERRNTPVEFDKELKELIESVSDKDINTDLILRLLQKIRNKERTKAKLLIYKILKEVKQEDIHYFTKAIGYIDDSNMNEGYLNDARQSIEKFLAPNSIRGYIKNSNQTKLNTKPRRFWNYLKAKGREYKGYRTLKNEYEKCFEETAPSVTTLRRKFVEPMVSCNLLEIEQGEGSKPHTFKVKGKRKRREVKREQENEVELEDEKLSEEKNEVPSIELGASVKSTNKTIEL